MSIGLAHKIYVNLSYDWAEADVCALTVKELTLIRRVITRFGPTN